MISGRNGKISFAVARTVAEIVFRPSGVPASLFGVDVVKTVLLTLIETNVVKDEEFRFGSEVSRVGNAGGSQIQFGFPCDVARITVVTLLGYGIDDIANEHERWNFSEGIEHVKTGVGHEQHVALVDGGPAANGRTVDPEAVFEGRFRQLLDGVGDVMPEAGQISEAEVQNLRVVLFGEVEDVLGISYSGVGHEDSLQ